MASVRPAYTEAARLSCIENTESASTSHIEAKDTQTRSKVRATSIHKHPPGNPRAGLRSGYSRRAAKLINYFSAVCCTSVTTPSCRTFSLARGVFIFVRNFSRGIFLRESLSKVVDDLTACASVSGIEILRKQENILKFPGH
jgi:hypothetical protein